MEKKELVIIGGGVAGLTSAIYACRKGIDNVVLEAELPMGQTAIAPMVENYPGFPEGITGMELMQRIEKQARRFGADIRTFERVTELNIKEGSFTITTNKQSYEAIAIIIAVGTKPVKIPEELDINEEKFLGRGLSYCATCDGPLFKDREVVVIGSENEAFNEALYLAEICSRVTIVTQYDINADRILVERFKKKGEIIEGKVKKIRGNEVVEGVVLENGREISASGIFIALGRKAPSIEIFERAGIKTVKRFIEVNRKQETNIPGIFAAGDITGMPFQIAKAVGEACIATINAYNYIKQHKV